MGKRSELTELFDSATLGEDKFDWHYGFYFIKIRVKEFFCGRQKQKRGHDRFTDAAESLIAAIGNDCDNEEVLKASERLLEQQRILENTQARRRLERWATRLISFYLVAVFLLVIANGIVELAIGSGHSLISSGIMGAILTTTTINIIGLGLIVLKGHFHSPNKNQE